MSDGLCEPTRNTVVSKSAVLHQLGQARTDRLLHPGRFRQSIESGMKSFCIVIGDLDLGARLAHPIPQPLLLRLVLLC